VRIEEVFWLYIWLIILANTGVALYGLVMRPKVLKKIACLTIIADTSFLILALIGYRFKYPLTPYIITNWSPDNETLSSFIEKSVDPLPPTLTITAVVINLSITILLVFLSIRLYEIYGTLNVRKIAMLKKSKSVSER